MTRMWRSELDEMTGRLHAAQAVAGNPDGSRRDADGVRFPFDSELNHSAPRSDAASAGRIILRAWVGGPAAAGHARVGRARARGCGDQRAGVAEMIFGSVCSGIEAASVAWAPLGWRAAFFSEIEPFPRAVLAHRHPGVPLHGDFTTIQAGDYEPIDLLVGGTPCQSFSIAGLRGGLDDDRGNLALEFLRLADRLRPRWLVWENVPGVLSSSGGRDFGAILGGLGELGYGFAYSVLDAQYFGVPQRRSRVFVVGYLGDWRAAAAVLFDRKSLSGDPAPRREPEARVAGVLAGVSPGGGWRVGADEAAAGQLVAGSLKANAAGADDNDARAGRLVPLAFGGNDTRGPIEVATALNAHGGPAGRLDFESETFIAHTLRGEGFDASEDGTGRGVPLVPVAYRTAGDGAVYEQGSATAPLTTGTDKSASIVAFHENQRGEITQNTTAGTLKTGGGKPGQGYPAALTGAGVRRLTPLECERLQGFPDCYTMVPMTRISTRKGVERIVDVWRRIEPDELGYLVAMGACVDRTRGRTTAPAEGARYKAIGNSMAVPVMRWIGERISMVEAILAERARAA